MALRVGVASAAMAARPYPYASWPRVDGADARLLRALLRGVPAAGALQRAQAEAETLLGVALRLGAGGAELIDAAELAPAAPWLALWLEHAEGARPLSWLCELPPELGAVLVDRVLGGDGGVAHPLGQGLDELSGGVLAYLAARLLAAADAGLRVRAVLDEPARAAELLGGGRVLSWSFELSLGATRAGRLRLLAPEASARALADRLPAPATGRVPAQLRGVPVALCACFAHTQLRRGELAALRPGDVVLPERCRLERGADGFVGEAMLHVAGAARGARFRCRARGAQLVLETLGQDGEAQMTEGKRIQTQEMESSGEALAADAPVELCLALARFTLQLGELSQLRPGEVLSTGRAIGEQALLCAGARVLARGELVDVDGEIGLRITTLER